MQENGTCFDAIITCRGQAMRLAPMVMESETANPFGLYRYFTRFGLPILHSSGIVISEYRKMLQTEGFI